MNLTTPYADVLPPLSTEERETLRLSIEAEGVRIPLIATEDGRLLDGHHRYAIDPDAPCTVITGSADWTHEECTAYALRSNLERRNLSADQKEVVRKQQQQLAVLFRRPPWNWTQERIAEFMGLPRETVRDLLADEVETNGETANGFHLPDCRVKVPTKEHEVIVARLAAGESQRQVAADYGITHPAVGKILTRHQKRLALEAERARVAMETAAAIGNSPVTVREGDFREVAKEIPDGAVSLIFTDPPYDRDSVPLYGDLAEVAKRVLRPGGSLLCYCGQYLLPDIIPLMVEHLDFYWCCACIHTGQKARMREYGLVVAWKPMLWFTNGPRPVYEKQEFVEDAVISGGRDKDAHDWQQSEVEARYYIERLSRPGELLFEPFAGGGTTPAVAVSLGRQIIASEIDPQKALQAEGRVRDAQR